MQPFLTAFYKLFVPTAMLLPKFLSYGWIIFDVYYVYCPLRDAAWFP